jgi:hypothetical protein
LVGGEKLVEVVTCERRAFGREDGRKKERETYVGVFLGLKELGRVSIVVLVD